MPAPVSAVEAIAVMPKTPIAGSPECALIGSLNPGAGLVFVIDPNFVDALGRACRGALVRASRHRLERRNRGLGRLGGSGGSGYDRRDYFIANASAFQGDQAIG